MENDASVRFLYGTVAGRTILKVIQTCRLDRAAVWFLRSPLSRPVISRYIVRNKIPMEEFQGETFRSFQAFFARKRAMIRVDMDPCHLISPCDGWLSAFPIREDSSFLIKGSHYRLRDLLQEPTESYHGGDCLIFRLCASDYHHYCYIDDGEQGRHHYIEGQLHSVQPIACETYPVYTLNRRVWSLLSTDHFGPVIQTEVGALIVGGIRNERDDGHFYRGMEKGHFELAGSTIVLLFQRGKIRLLPHIQSVLDGGGEARVTQGMWIGEQIR
jgi:phosphatidylserine decarboxylase